MACLRERSAEEVVEAQDRVCSGVAPSCFLPTVDGQVAARVHCSSPHCTASLCTSPQVVLSAEQASNMTSTVPLLLGSTTNEGFLRLMEFLAREFPTDRLERQGFSREMARSMVAKMFPGLSRQSQAVLDFLYSSWAARAPKRASPAFLSLEAMVGSFLLPPSPPSPPSSRI